MSADDIIDLYERHAHEWVGDRSRQTQFFEKGWLDRFTAMVPAGATILDLGCGPAKPMAAYLLAQGFDVCGVDSSPTMIALARANFPDRQWLVADMRTLALGRRFAGIMAWDSFFHLDFDDQRRMFPVFRDACGAGSAAFVHQRTAPWRSHRQLARRSALPRQPRARGISFVARRQ